MSKKKKEQVHEKLVKFLTRFPEIDPDEWQRRRDVWIISEKFLKKLSQMNHEGFERNLNRLIDNLIDILPKFIEEGEFSGKLSKLCDELEAIRTC